MELPLTSLTITQDKLGPTFHSQDLEYSVPDFKSANDTITLTTTEKFSCFVVFAIAGSNYRRCPQCRSAQSHTRMLTVIASINTTGFRMDLGQDDCRFLIHVYRESVHQQFWRLTVTRPGNTPAPGQPVLGGTTPLGQSRRALTKGIACADGLTNVTFCYRWVRKDSIRTRK